LLIGAVFLGDHSASDIAQRGRDRLSGVGAHALPSKAERICGYWGSGPESPPWLDCRPRAERYAPWIQQTHGDLALLASRCRILA
jgi:hypothetical protein